MYTIVFYPVILFIVSEEVGNCKNLNLLTTLQLLTIVRAEQFQS